jgi:hypothetical protein
MLRQTWVMLLRVGALKDEVARLNYVPSIQIVIRLNAELNCECI